MRGEKKRTRCAVILTAEQGRDEARRGEHRTLRAVIGADAEGGGVPDDLCAWVPVGALARRIVREIAEMGTLGGEREDG